ncbi:hypothetical protein [Tahibacter caeni]|uniref:hypothetical protein n=1 Tax=Tahibacter caeni TaxID=1453545 RepID=UPI00214964B6|nr:hypothetical protein [Tahibacter caeni]
MKNLALISAVIMLFLLPTTLWAADNQPVSRSDHATERSKFEPTHCRETVVKISTNEKPIISPVRKPKDDGDFLTDAGYDYQIIGGYCSGSEGIPNHWCIEKGERVDISRDGKGNLSLRHTKYVGPKKIELVKATLTLEPKEKIWASGEATTPDGTPIGTYVIFLRPQEKSCRHTKVSKNQYNKKPPCKSILFEYFANGDNYAKEHLPVISANKTNVTPAPDMGGYYECPDPPSTPVETSDGEGDYGPDKP